MSSLPNKKQQIRINECTKERLANSVSGIGNTVLNRIIAARPLHSKTAKGFGPKKMKILSKRFDIVFESENANTDAPTDAVGIICKQLNELKLNQLSSMLNEMRNVQSDEIIEETNDELNVKRNMSSEDEALRDTDYTYGYRVAQTLNGSKGNHTFRMDILEEEGVIDLRLEARSRLVTQRSSIIIPRIIIKEIDEFSNFICGTEHCGKKISVLSIYDSDHKNSVATYKYHR
eukprot:889311_1